MGNLEAGIGIVTQQHEEANNFYKENTNKNTKGEITIYGHSKGGNLSTYVFLKNLKDNVKAYIVNGAPICYLGLSDKEKGALNSGRFTFITYVGDIVSHLGFAPYVDKIVVPHDLGKEIDPFFFHYETSVDFNEKDGRFAHWYNHGDWQLKDAKQDILYLQINTALFTINKSIEVEVAVGAATLEIIHLAAKARNKAAQLVIDQCLKFLARVNNVTKQVLTDVANFLVNTAHQTRLFFAKVVESTKRSIAHAEEIIKVDLSRLYYYIERLQAVKRKTARVNDLIDDLYWQAGVMGLDNILKADLSTMFNFKLTDSINYLSSTAETLELVESMLSNKAGRF
ncbi:Mbeg1-like protein [Bacillus sp. 1NLA3E]|uniref:Mbeg1-like protein n=1 Tax=Bacillus sp. 1NLA3E TaxID=666686 RepID=UPI00165151C1|nr:Mbeg1-like protein [Bacillus sp. 1NLA3E]